MVKTDLRHNTGAGKREALLDGGKHMTVSGYEPVILTSQDVEADLDSLQKQPGPQDNSKDG